MPLYKLICNRETSVHIYTFTERQQRLTKVMTSAVDTHQKDVVFSKYWKAIRPWSFLVSFNPVLLAACLAFKIYGIFNVFLLTAALLTIVAVHAAGNLVNTYYDFKKGVDGKQSDDRTLVDGSMSVEEIAQFTTLCYCVASAGLFTLLVFSPASKLSLAIVYCCGLLGSFIYTGGLGLKYIALGDIAILVIFGPLTFTFAFLSVCGKISLTALLYVVPLVLNSECILHANNFRDHDKDKSAGIVTLSILLGKKLSAIFFYAAMFLPYLMILYTAVSLSSWFYLPFVTMYLALPMVKSFIAGDLQELPQRLAKHHMIFGIAYTIAASMSPMPQLSLFL